MQWWQWVFQITGAWFYLALITAGAWAVFMRFTRRPRTTVRRTRETVFHNGRNA